MVEVDTQVPWKRIIKGVFRKLKSVDGPVGSTYYWGWECTFMQLGLPFTPAPTQSLPSVRRHKPAIHHSLRLPPRMCYCSRPLQQAVGWQSLQTPVEAESSLFTGCASLPACRVFGRGREPWLAQSVQLMLSFIGSLWGKPESRGLISLAPQLLFWQTDVHSGMVMHIRSGSGALQGILWGLEEINSFMEIKMSGGGLDMVPPGTPNTFFLHTQLC